MPAVNRKTLKFDAPFAHMLHSLQDGQHRITSSAGHTVRSPNGTGCLAPLLARGIDAIMNYLEFGGYGYAFGL